MGCGEGPDELLGLWEKDIGIMMRGKGQGVRERYLLRSRSSGMVAALGAAIVYWSESLCRWSLKKIVMC